MSAAGMIRIVAPTDSQLAYIAGLCEDRNLEPPQAIASMQEASEIIDRIKRREYDPNDYAYPFSWENDLPF